ncbi:hypothetical protein SAMN05444157_3855 [Frankineae bacterium MT45]|nr:hypothetical protein SAMN05444157_3855 [Frankineae bacterium MT45]
MNPAVLVASDLDRTLIYSQAAAGAWEGALRCCVEVLDGAPLSFMTEAAATSLTALAAACTFVPVTTRTVAQLRRVQLPAAHEYAVAANGGVLLRDGEPDAAWANRVVAALASALPYRRMWEQLQPLAERDWVRKLRSADDLFCYAVLDRAAVPPDFLAETTAWAAEHGWRTSLQGRKLYWVPDALTKSAAVAEVARRQGSDLVLAAGDSLLDIDLLAGADRGIRPAHGELAEQGWSAPHVAVTPSRGVAAGEEIVAWFHHGVRGELREPGEPREPGGQPGVRLASEVPVPIR